MIGRSTRTILSLLVATLFLAACGSGSRRVEVPRLAGQILDARTQEPIEGVVVYQFYETFNRRAGTHQGTGSRDSRWTMTDADGRFEFPAHVVAEALRNFVHVYPTPAIILLHHDYGSPNVHAPEDRTGWESIVWEIEPDMRTLQYMQFEDSRCSAPCSGLEGASYNHCYQIACRRPRPKGHGVPE